MISGLNFHQTDNAQDPSFAVLELFSGAGSLALGLHEASLKPHALIECDRAACANLRANMAKGCTTNQ